MPVPQLSLYGRPDENWASGSVVTVTSGTIDSAYIAGWLTDERPSRPFKATNGTATVSMAKTAATIGGIAICNHNIDAARTITIGGGVIAGTTAGPAARPNLIPYGAWFKLSAPTSLGVLSIGVASNSAAIRIGEVFACPMREFPGGGLLINGISGSNEEHGDASGATSVPKYDNGEASRTWSSTVLCTPSQLDDMMAWFESQKNGSRPSLFVPDADVNDAWLVKLLKPTWSLEPSSQDIYYCTLTMQEYPRVRW